MAFCRNLTQINASSASSTNEAASILVQRERGMTKKSLILLAVLLGIGVAVSVGTKAYSTGTYYQNGWTCPSC